LAASASQRMEGLNLSFSGAWLTKLILVKMENHSTLQIAQMTQMETGNTVLKILIIFTLVSFILSAHTNYTIAQVEGNEQQDEWNPISIGPATTWTASLCGKGEFVIQPFFFYSMARGMFDTEGNYDSLPGGDKKHQFQQQLFAQYGITDRLEIDGQLIYQENFAKQDGSKANSHGYGDSYLFLRHCIVEEKGWLPHITGLFQLKLPTGKYQHADPDKLETDLMGTGSYDHGYGFILSKRIKPFKLHADATYSFTEEVRVDGVKTNYGNYLNYDFGIDYFLPKGFDLLFEINGFLQGDKEEDGTKIPASDSNSLTSTTGVSWSNGKLQTLLGYQRAQIGTNADANDAVVFTLIYPF